MKRKPVLAAGALLALLGLCPARTSPAAEPPPAGPPPALAPPSPPDGEIASGDLRIFGPYSHKNLALYLIQGKDRLEGKEFLTLKEALEGKKIVVHETGNVNELSVENLSDTQAVYIQSGEIVKGGRQDRTLQHDMIVPPKSGKLPIASFCVEQGRWSRRGDEEAGSFAESENSVSSKDIKIAAKVAQSQGEVWEKVAENQNKLSANVGQSVQHFTSASSYQLSLENEKVQEDVGGFRKALERIVEGREEVVGYAFAINGQMNSADLYGSRALFRKLWEKNLAAAATEAVAEMKKDAPFSAPNLEVVKTFLEDAEKGKEGPARDVAPNVVEERKETDKNLLFETREAKAKAKADPAAPASEEWIHRNYLAK